MNEKALGYVIIFAILMFLNKFTCRPIWTMVCLSSGKTPAAGRVYRKKVRKSDNPPKNFFTWLVKSSDNPTRTRNLLMKYFVCMLPAFVCLIVAIIGLNTHFFDKFLDIATFIILGFNLIALIVSSAFLKRSL